MLTPNPRIGPNITYHRERLGLTRSELAEIVGTETEYLRTLEKRQAHPGIVMIARIAAALGVSMHELTKKE